LPGNSVLSLQKKSELSILGGRRRGEGADNKRTVPSPSLSKGGVINVTKGKGTKGKEGIEAAGFRGGGDVSYKDGRHRLEGRA